MWWQTWVSEMWWNVWSSSQPKERSTVQSAPRNQLHSWGTRKRATGQTSGHGFGEGMWEPLASPVLGAHSFGRSSLKTLLLLKSGLDLRMEQG